MLPLAVRLNKCCCHNSSLHKWCFPASPAIRNIFRMIVFQQFDSSFVRPWHTLPKALAFVKVNIHTQVFAYLPCSCGVFFVWNILGRHYEIFLFTADNNSCGLLDYHAVTFFYFILLLTILINFPPPQFITLKTY